MGDVLVESNRHRKTFVSGRLAGVSACAGRLVAVSSASTIACGPELGFTIAYVLSPIGPDHATPATLAPARYFLAGALSSPAAASETLIFPLPPRAGCFASGGHARPSGGCSF